MIIGGFQKNSLIDFPRTIACVVFTQGCNFCCPYCHNPDLVAGRLKTPGLEYDQEKIFRFLEARKDLLEGVAVTGGEPTLQKDIGLFCKRVKSMGYRVKLDTNGTRPQVLKTLLEQNLLDYVAMDIKTGLDQYHTVWTGKVRLGNIQESIGLIMEKAPDYEFRTTCAKPFVSDSVMMDIGKMIQGAKRYYLQKCSSNVTVLEPGFFKKKNPGFTATDLISLKRRVEPYVDKVDIR